MLEINVVNLKKYLDILNNLINEYEEIQLNLFNELKDSCINWQDENSLEFDNNIYLEKQEANYILQSLIDKKEILNFIYEKYSNLGKKIQCNLRNKNALIYSIDNCQNQINSIINEFYRIDNSFYYYERYKIYNQKNEMFKIRNKLVEIRNSVNKTFNRIEEIEKEISEKINQLDEIRINNFDYNLV